MTEVDLLTFGEAPSLRAGRKVIGRLLVVFTAVSSCATGRLPPQEPKVLPNDLSCERDDECEILDHSVYGNCCWWGHESEPYAISRVAVERHRAQREAECADVACDLVDYQRLPFCRTESEEWIAVCTRHVCTRASIHLFFSPKTVECER
jgi:hypothetical protein